jgi:hypothetical protein
MNAAPQRGLRQAGALEYPKDRARVPFLSAVRRREHGQLTVRQSEAVHCARQDGGHDLERLRRRAKEHRLRGVPQRDDEIAVRVAHGGDSAVQASDVRTPLDGDKWYVTLERFRRKLELHSGERRDLHGAQL